MSDNLALWNTVSKTDPAHTKKVNQRGGFTAISAHYQIMSATKQFGPLGIGWGYTNSLPVTLGEIVSVGVTIWHGERANEFGPVWGGADLKDSKGKPDSDAPKKASTDGLTKGLSQLGFNADVFLGRFDDNKCVEEMKREFADAGESNVVAMPERLPPADQAMIDTIAIAPTVKALRDWLRNNQDKALASPNAEKITAAFNERMAGLRLLATANA